MVALQLGAMINPSDQLTEKIKANLRNSQLYYSPEKVYIHHDKPYYLAGDTFWFKAYILDAANLESSSKSGVLYVDLINQDQQMVDRLTLPISEGEAFGDFYLGEDLGEGNYTLVGYTNWMRNFGEEIFFQKDFYVLGKQYKKPVSATEPNQGSIDLQFFPEGGVMIAGIPNEVAFKALNPDGLGESVEGGIYDEQGAMVAEFKDHFAGMGSFVFTPKPATQYVAISKKEKGETMEYPLPEIKEQGWVLHIDEVNDPENILVTVQSINQDSKTAMFFGIARENLIHAEEITTDESGSKFFKTSKKNFPTGVIRFILTDMLGEALAERLVFVNHSNTSQVSLQIEKKVYQTREKVNLSIRYQGEEELSHLFVSVTADKLAHTHEHQGNIQSYLLLGSDIKGNIEFPGYYFESDDTERLEALRHLMMTQSWRRLGWESIVAGNFPLMRYPNELDLNIRGRLERANGSPVEKGEATLYLKDKYTTFMLTETNKEGDFAFRGFYFKGSIPVVIQGVDNRGRRDNVEVKMLENDFVPKITENRILFNGRTWENLEGFSPNPQQAVEGIETEIWGLELGEVLLQEVVVEGRADVYEPFKLHTRADAVILREQLPVAPSGNVLEVLQGRVAGLQVIQTGMGEFRAVIRGMGTPLYLLDGIPIDESSLMSINQFDINRIEILRGPGTAGIYGGRGSGGVIAFFSEMGALDEEVDPEGGKHILVHQAPGFNRTRQFYSPKYETAEYYDLPDLRSTVYWNPTVLIGPNSKREISFYTGDVTGRHRVQVEGMTKDGQPISEVFYFEVN